MKIKIVTDILTLFIPSKLEYGSHYNHSNLYYIFNSKSLWSCPTDCTFFFTLLYFSRIFYRFYYVHNLKYSQIVKNYYIKYKNINILNKFKKLIYCPNQCASVGWVSFHKAKGRQFDSWSAHMPGLWVPGRGAYKRQIIDVSLLHQRFSPSLFPYLSLFLKINKIFYMFYFFKDFIYF